MSVSILLTGANGLMAHFILKALKASALDLRIIGCDHGTLGAGLLRTHVGYVVPSASEEAYLPRVIDICRRENVRLVLVHGAEERHILAQNKDTILSETGAFVVTPPDDILTRIEDKFANPSIEPFTLADLGPDDFVRMRGSELADPAATADLLAALLERDDPRDTELQGFVESALNPTLTILGVTIESNGATVFRTLDGSAISAGDFFSQVQAGDLVKAIGAEIGPTTILADEVQFELEF